LSVVVYKNPKYEILLMNSEINEHCTDLGQLANDFQLYIAVICGASVVAVFQILSLGSAAEAHLLATRRYRGRCRGTQTLKENVTTRRRERMGTNTILGGKVNPTQKLKCSYGCDTRKLEINRVNVSSAE
jgi:hypothetical protein